MISVRSARPGDIEAIGQLEAEPWVRAHAGELQQHLAGNPNTLVGELDGVAVCMGGYIDMGHGIAIAWAVVGDVPKRAFVPICRTYRSHLRGAPFHWIEAHCAEGVEQQFRWVRCLGFEPLLGDQIFAPDGRELKRFIFRG